MIFEKDNILYYHDIRQNQYEVFNNLKNDKNFIICNGPVYKSDPAEIIIEPFKKSCEFCGYKFDVSTLPKNFIEKIAFERSKKLNNISKEDLKNLLNWSLYATVLEKSYINGITVNKNIIHIDYILNNTVTSRDGFVTTHDVNPHFVTDEISSYIRPSDYTRNIVILDFKAMDVYSMMTLLPSVKEYFKNCVDPYSIIASLCSIERSDAKMLFLKWAYGGKIQYDIEKKFIDIFSEIFEYSRRLEYGEFARIVQNVSSIVFRSSIAAVAKKLVFDKNFIPMFTVHDSIVIDVSDYGVENLNCIISAMEEKTFQETGIKYSITSNCGYTYFEAKNNI